MKTDISDAPQDVVYRAAEWLATRPVGDEAFKTACGLRDFGLSFDQALKLLANYDGRPESVLRPKVAHAYRSGRS